MDDMCILGPVSKDVIYHGRRKAMESIGGVPVYGGLAAARLGISVQIITKWAETDQKRFNKLTNEDSVRVRNMGAEHTTSFDLMYDSDMKSDRILRLTASSSPFHPDDLQPAHTKLIYLAPLMPSDINLDVIRTASEKSAVALDVQGLLRQSIDGVVQTADWQEKVAALSSIGILKASQVEAACLTGTDDPDSAARQIAAWGVDEVIITRDRWGALILSKGESIDIPAFAPPRHTDTTGCGDTFFAAYLSQRLQEQDSYNSGRFAAAAAALKIGSWGPSHAGRDEIMDFMTSTSC